MWEEEKEKLIEAYRGIKKKNRKSRDTIKKLKNLRNDIRDM